MDKQKKRNIFLGVAAALGVIVIAIIVFIFCINPNTPDGNSTNNTEYQGSIIGEQPNNSELNPDTSQGGMQTINGIPSYMFDSTSGKSFEFYIQDNRDGYIFRLTSNSKFKDFEYEFLTDPDPSHQGVSDPIVITIEPGKTALNVEGDYDKPNDIFVFGGLNETDKTITGIDDATLVYVSYRGSSDWTLCGLSCDMSKDDVVKKLGQPTQEVPSDEGLRMEYYILSNGHTYLLVAMLNEETNTVQKIEWAMDNHPVFVNNIVPDDVIMDTHTHEE